MVIINRNTMVIYRMDRRNGVIVACDINFSFNDGIVQLVFCYFFELDKFVVIYVEMLFDRFNL